MIRYLGRTTPTGKRIVFAIAYDEYGDLDTITNTATGERLTSTSYDGKRIVRNAAAIAAGKAPLDFWHARKPDGYNPDAEPCRWFLNCVRPATTTVPHPVLGDVPCCAQCAAFATA